MISRAQHTKDIDSPVALKILVFDRNNGLPQNRGQRFIGNHDAAFEGEGAEDAAMHVE